MSASTPVVTDDDAPAQPESGGLGLLAALLRGWRLLLLVPLLAGALAVGATYLIPKTYTAATVLLPTQPPQSAAASVLSSLGGLAGAVAGASSRSSGEQYVALMQTVRLERKIIDAFSLDKVYETEFRFQTHRLLKEFVQITSDRRSGLIRIEVDDGDPQRAAAIANAYVDELRKLTSELTLTEAQQRRKFFEQQLERTRDQLARSQRALQSSGFGQSTLRAEPKIAAEGYAKLMAELTSAELRLQMLRGYLAEQAPELRQQTTLVAGLRAQLEKLESAPRAESDPDYLSRYREFKYQEALFELFARQYEAARVDESRDAPVLQVVDVATVPEYKSKPRRAPIGAAVAAIALLLTVSVLVLRHWLRTRSEEDAAFAAGLAELRAAVGRR